MTTDDLAVLLADVDDMKGRAERAMDIARRLHDRAGDVEFGDPTAAILYRRRDRTMARAAEYRRRALDLLVTFQRRHPPSGVATVHAD